MKAQMSVEYLILIGLVFVAIIPLFYYALSESGRNIQMNQANDVVNTLAKTADTVYSLGPGSQKIVQITMPGGVESITIDDNEVWIKLHIFGGTADVFVGTKATLTGNIPTTSGPHLIIVKTLDDGRVEIKKFGE